MNVLITAIFQIVIFLVIAAIVFAFIKATLKNAKFLNGNVIMSLMAGYVAILLISLIYTYTIPTEASDMTTKQAHVITENFYNIVNNGGNIADVEGVSFDAEWNFPFAGDLLDINTILPNDDHVYTWVVVEKNENLHDEIQIKRYITPYVVDEIDYTDLVPKPTLELQNDRLTIKYSRRSEIRLVKFHKEFTITQFTDEKMFDDYDSSWSANLLHIQVPGNVKVKADESVNLQRR
ncbi:MAG: hypothetical protein ACK4M9_06810 [Anaerobacillus sp.]|uniref:hypothetical protein n=1 Tax=Anaerobacillus sp. TaxID=1872506 RepID=UPI00391C5FCC